MTGRKRLPAMVRRKRPASKERPIMFVDSIEERLTKAIHGINLIQLALAADATEAGLHEQDVIEAIAPLASEVHEQLYFARLALPKPVKDLPAPGVDEEDGETMAQHESRIAAAKHPGGAR